MLFKSSCNNSCLAHARACALAHTCTLMNAHSHVRSRLYPCSCSHAHAHTHPYTLFACPRALLMFTPVPTPVFLLKHALTLMCAHFSLCSHFSVLTLFCAYSFLRFLFHVLLLIMLSPMLSAHTTYPSD